MLVKLQPEEEILMQMLAADRVDAGKRERKISKYMTPYTVCLMGISGEYLIAKTLGMFFDPTTHRGGDGHRRDLWRGDVTVSVKTKSKHLPADFLFVPSQHPGQFPDDYGVVGRWVCPYTVIDIVGFFDALDWRMYHEPIAVRGGPKNESPLRDGYAERHLRDIEELIYEIDMVEDATFSAVQDYGYFECIRDWHRRGRCPVL